MKAKRKVKIKEVHHCIQRGTLHRLDSSYKLGCEVCVQYVTNSSLQDKCV